MPNRHRYDELIDHLRAKTQSVAIRKIALAGSDMWLVFIRQLVDVKSLSQFVIKPAMEYCETALARPRARKVAESIISVADCNVESDPTKIQGHILKGMAVLLLSNDDEYVVVNLKQVEHRAVDAQEIAYSVHGPKDSFVENLDINLSLVRSRLQDPNLKIDMFELGRRTRTSVAAIYIEDIADPDTVNRIEAKLRAIDTDAILGSGEVEGFLCDTKHDLFSRVRTSESPAWACEAILEGKVGILVDGGHIALIAPTTFGESFHANDDKYNNKFFGLFSKLIRYLAVLVTLCSTSIYIALVSYHTDALPSGYAILLAQMRKSVLFPAPLEVIIVELILELVREALLRVPSKIGTAIGIVGAIIIGSASISAGLFDALVLILVCASLLSSFALPDYFAMNPIRILKFFMIFMTGIMGFYGFVLAMSMILTNLVSIDSFGVPYFAPFAPYNRYDFKRAFIFSRDTSALRMQYMRTKDDTRSSYAHTHLDKVREKAGGQEQEQQGQEQQGQGQQGQQGQQDKGE